MILAICLAIGVILTVTSRDAFFPTVVTRVVVYSVYWSPFFIAATIAVIFPTRAYPAKIA